MVGNRALLRCRLRLHSDPSPTAESHPRGFWQAELVGTAARIIRRRGFVSVAKAVEIRSCFEPTKHHFGNSKLGIVRCGAQDGCGVGSGVRAGAGIGADSGVHGSRAVGANRVKSGTDVGGVGRWVGRVWAGGRRSCDSAESAAKELLEPHEAHFTLVASNTRGAEMRVSWWRGTVFGYDFERGVKGSVL